MARWYEPGLRGPLLLAAAIMAMPLLQLVPLPPSLWTALPSHSAIRVLRISTSWHRASVVSGEPQPRRNMAKRSRTPPPITMFLAIIAWIRPLTARPDAVSHLLRICLPASGPSAGCCRPGGGPFRILQCELSRRWLLHQQQSLRCAPLHHDSVYCCLDRWSRCGSAPANVGGDWPLHTYPCLSSPWSRCCAVARRIGPCHACGASQLALARTGNKHRYNKGTAYIPWPFFIGTLAILQFSLLEILQELESDALADVEVDLRGRNVRRCPRLPTGWVGPRHLCDSLYKVYETPDMLTASYVNNAHNDFAELFLEGGLLAIIPVAFFFGPSPFLARLWRKTP